MCAIPDPVPDPDSPLAKLLDDISRRAAAAREDYLSGSPRRVAHARADVTHLHAMAASALTMAGRPLLAATDTPLTPLFDHGYELLSRAHGLLSRADAAGGWTVSVCVEAFSFLHRLVATAEEIRCELARLIDWKREDARLTAVRELRTRADALYIDAVRVDVGLPPLEWRPPGSWAADVAAAGEALGELVSLGDPPGAGGGRPDDSGPPPAGEGAG